MSKLVAQFEYKAVTFNFLTYLYIVGNVEESCTFALKEGFLSVSVLQEFASNSCH